MKSRVSGSAPAIGVSKNCAGAGWMMVRPDEAKKTAICSCAPSEMARAVAFGLVGCPANKCGFFGIPGSARKARSWR